MNAQVGKCRTILGALGVLLFTSAANAQVTSISVASQTPPGGVLPGYVVNDLFIDFEASYGGSQMVVELDSGTIYQDPNPFAGDLAPIPALLGLHPTLEWDTFVANGGSTSEHSASSYGLGEGPAIGLPLDPGEPVGGERPGRFDETGIDAQWNPTGGADVSSQTDFMVARVTLSDDANGTLRYLAAAGGVIGVPHAVTTGLSPNLSWPGDQVPGGAPGERFVAIPIVGGIVGGIPEPSSAVLLGVGLVGLFLLTRRRG